MQNGFITLPILIIAILGAMVVGGGSYAVYKVNQIEQESSSRVNELERKFDEVSNSTSSTEMVAINEASTTLETVSGSEINIDAEAVPVTTKLSQKTEANSANVIAEYYQSIALQTIDGYIDLLDLTVTEINRYLNGIPTVKNNFSNMILVSFDKEAADGAEAYIDEWGNGYINDFTDLKKRVMEIQSELKIQRDTLIKISGDLRSQYVPVSQSPIYTKEIDAYDAKIKAWIGEVKLSMNQLTTRFIEDKDYTNELIYNAGVKNINTSKPTLPTYYPPSVNTASYKPPIKTYCDNFGSSISCTSYSY